MRNLIVKGLIVLLSFTVCSILRAEVKKQQGKEPSNAKVLCQRTADRYRMKAITAATETDGNMAGNPEAEEALEQWREKSAQCKLME